MDYLIHIAVLICVFAILAQSLNLLAGYTGVLSLAQAALFGTGAYAYALLASRANLPYPLALFSSVVLTGIVGFLLALPVVRSRDDYVVLVTFAFQVLATSVMNNLHRVTGGPTGFPGIPQPSLVGIAIDTGGLSLAFVMVAAVGTIFLIALSVRAPAGRILMGTRDDEIWMQSAGYNTIHVKIFVFTISSAVAGLAGCLYAGHLTFIDPTSFTLVESVFVLSIVVIGGAGSVRGPIIGAALLVGLPEVLRLVGMPASVAANIRQIAYGLLLVVIVLLRPRGLCGSYGFQNGGHEG